MREKKIFFVYMAASAYHVISKEVKNQIFRQIEFLDTPVYINNRHEQSSGSILFLCKCCSYFRYTGKIFLGCALFVARCNIIRAL